MNTRTVVETHRFTICIDCAMHIANGEGGCCDSPEHERFHGEFGPEVCEVATRMNRRWTRHNIVGVTLDGREDNDGEEYSEYGTSECDSCGNGDHGERIRATGEIAHPLSTRRTLRHGPWTVVVTQYDRTPFSPMYARVDRLPGYGRYMGTYCGANRYADLLAYIRSLPTAKAIVNSFDIDGEVF